MVDTLGGTSRILFTAGARWSPGCGCSFRHPWVFNPTYSPDGTQIAYSDGIGDNSHLLQVMNADGSGTHVIVGEQQGHTMHNLAWSPDGERLVFGLGRSSGIYIVGADGSGLTLVIPDATYPYWSPDGSRISYQPPGEFTPLEIADADGMHVVEFGYGGSGPWNPLVQPEPGVVDVPAQSEGLIPTSTLVLVMALLALLVGAALIRRRVRSERRECATGSVRGRKKKGFHAHLPQIAYLHRGGGPGRRHARSASAHAKETRALRRGMRVSTPLLVLVFAAPLAWAESTDRHGGGHRAGIR